ncbi:ABC1 kinase family protein [Cyanobacterium sp. uoEpiScrs1]|uniref:ABC1 kinase family protein n=1 Tax=Cyanobacterium sp. uoEpiScrs1 TaxID=2976343 RepID=UPI00226AB72B|nr:AarF/ABC1/UbiB kinase family protein [Cyanobacterium sp. uoEpiScrs1]
MSEVTVSSVVESPDLITIEAKHINISQSNSEDLGPISNFSPESWSYHPESIKEYYSKRFLEVLHRLISIASQSFWFFLSLWWDKLRGINPKNNRKRAIQLRKILTKLGPTYIKVGQALSTRPDLLPPNYIDELISLQDNIPSFPNEVAYRFIEEELGEPPEEIYAEISSNPLAAASLGQVYKGKLKNGEKVAVKVQRPDLIRRITLDIYLIRNIASWAQKTFKFIRSDLVSITDELASRIFEEINYIQEGKNAEKFAEFYGHLPEIYVPKIYWKYTGRRVLTMEWVEGTKLTDIQKVQEKGINATHLIEVGVQCSLRQLLEHGFFHADPHPGNLLAMDNGQLAYLDFGMMSHIKPYQRYGLIEAVVHLVNRDFKSLANDYVKLDFLQPDTDLSPIIPALSQVFGNALGASVAELNFKSITDQMSAMMYEFPFRVPAYYALIIRSMVTLEGIAIGIDPNFKVLSKAYPYVAKRLLTDPSQELRTSLKNLLFQDGNFRWNRLENLLRNAKDSQDYDIDGALNQATDFLFSERGAFIRESIIDEMINTVDLLGRRTWFNTSSVVRKQVGLAVQEIPLDLKNNGQTTEHIKNILRIIQDTPGFDPIHLVPIVTKLLVKPEIQQMGQKIFEGLMQKAVARIIRNLLLELDKPRDQKSTTSSTQNQKSLPVAS